MHRVHTSVKAAIFVSLLSQSELVLVESRSGAQRARIRVHWEIDNKPLKLTIFVIININGVLILGL